MTTNKWNIYKLTLTVLHDRKTCIDWLINEELLPRSRNCPICKKPMILDVIGHPSGRFRCQKMHTPERIISQPLVKNT